MRFKWMENLHAIAEQFKAGGFVKDVWDNELLNY